MAYAAGVDVGSTQTKAVIIDESGRIVGRALVDTGANVIAAAQNAFDEALSAENLSEQGGRVRDRHRLRALPRHLR